MIEGECERCCLVCAEIAAGSRASVAVTVGGANTELRYSPHQSCCDSPCGVNGLVQPSHTHTHTHTHTQLLTGLQTNSPR